MKKRLCSRDFTILFFFITSLNQVIYEGLRMIHKDGFEDWIIRNHILIEACVAIDCTWSVIDAHCDAIVCVRSRRPLDVVRIIGMIWQLTPTVDSVVGDFGYRLVPGAGDAIILSEI